MKAKTSKLTMTKAKTLIKRELGINATGLEKPPIMNGNPSIPWYELYSGTTRIAVYAKESGPVSYVVLSIHFENSCTGVAEYFYADTLEFAAEATAVQKSEELYEKASDIHDWDAYLAHAGRACREVEHKQLSCK